MKRIIRLGGFLLHQHRIKRVIIRNSYFYVKNPYIVEITYDCPIAGFPAPSFTNTLYFPFQTTSAATEFAHLAGVQVVNIVKREDE